MLAAAFPAMVAAAAAVEYAWSLTTGAATAEANGLKVVGNEVGDAVVGTPVGRGVGESVGVVGNEVGAGVVVLISHENF